MAVNIIIPVTWSTTDKGSAVTLSNGNLTMSSSTGYTNGGIRATKGVSSGKWYWEYTLVSGYFTVGIANINASLTTYAGSSNRVNMYCKYNTSNGIIYPGGMIYGGSLNSGDVISVALDMDLETVVYYKNGISQGIAKSDIKSSIGDVIYPYVSSGDTSSYSIIANFGSSSFSYLLPIGYQSLNNSNTMQISLANIQSTTQAMSIGDFIPCRYTAPTSGQVGTFSELGITTATAIPVASSATPDGSFNFIMVDTDYKGRKMLVADRNVQNSIAWDVLNTSGVASGSGVIVDKNTKTFSKLPNSTTLPTGIGNETSFSPDGTYMSVVSGASPYVLIYKKSSDVFTKLSDPSVLPTGAGQGTSFSPDGNYMSVTHGTAPFITIYKRSGDTFTKLPDPSILPTGQGNRVSFSPDSSYMIVGHNISPYVTIYQISNDIFTKTNNPTSLPTGSCYGVSFSPDGVYVTATHDITPFLTIYKKSANIFTKLSNPTTLPTGIGMKSSFSPNGNYLTVAHYITPFITIYKRSGDVFTKLLNPSTLPTGLGYGANFSPDGNYLAITHDITPFVSFYRQFEDTFIKTMNPFTLPTGTGVGVSFSNDGNYVSIAHNTTPFFTIYAVKSISSDMSNNYYLRLPIGGISATDLDNEWIKYIANSTLNETIVAGDNNVWNWSTKYSWTNTTNTANGNTYRSVLGNGSASNWNAYLSNDTTVAFRPVLIAETIKPLSPTGITTTNLTYNSVTLTWTPSTNATSYNIYSLDGNLLTNVLTPSYEISNLTENTPYGYSITALNEGGESLATPCSFLTLPIPVPDIPTNIQITSNISNSVTITWNTDEKSESYNIYNSDNSLFVNIPTSTYTFATLSENTSYQFTITGINPLLESEKSEPITILTIPANPIINTDNITNNSAQLMWINIIGLVYKLYDNSDVIIDSNIVSPYDIISLEKGTNYTYKIGVSNASGESEKTIISFITIPTEVTDLISSNITTNSATISWTGVVGASGYNIYDVNNDIITNIIETSYNLSDLISGSENIFKVSAMNVSGESSKTEVIFITDMSEVVELSALNITSESITLLWNNNPYAIGYNIYDVNDNLIGQTIYNEFEIIELNEGTNYTFKVTAYTDIKESNKISINVLTLPSSPIVTIVDIKTTTILLSWEEVPNVSTYRIFNSNHELIGTTSNLYYEIQFLESNTSYQYYISSFNSSGDSEYTVIEFITLIDKIAEITVSEILSTSVVISWSLIYGATSYNIYDVNNTLIANTSNLFYRIRDLISDTDYVFKASALNSEVESDKSQIEFTTSISNYGRITDYNANLSINSQRKIVRDSKDNIWICYDSIYNSTSRIFVRKIQNGSLYIWDGTNYILNKTGIEVPIEELEGYDQVNPTLTLESANGKTLVIDDVAMITYIATAMVSSGAVGTIIGDAIAGYTGTLWDSAKNIFYSMQQTMIDSLRNIMIAEACGYFALNNVNGLWEFLHSKYLIGDTLVPVMIGNINPSIFFVQGFNIQVYPDWSMPNVIQSGGKISYPAIVMLRDTTQDLVTLNATYYIYDPEAKFKWKSGGLSNITFRSDELTILGSNNTLKSALINYLTVTFPPYGIYGNYISTTHVGYLDIDSSMFIGNYPSTTLTAVTPIGITNDGDNTRFINPPLKPISLNNATTLTTYLNRVGILSTAIPTLEEMNASDNVDFTKNETIHLLWSGTDTNNPIHKQIKHSMFHTDVWLEWTNVAPIIGYDQNFPSTSIDSSDGLHAVWFGKDPLNSEDQIKYSEYNYDIVSRIWTSYINIQEVTGYPLMYPNIAIDQYDNMTVVCHGKDPLNDNYQIKESTNNGNGWSVWLNIHPIANYDRMYPSIAINSRTNEKYISCQGTDSSQSFSKIKFSMYNGTTWSEWVNVENITGYDQIFSSITYCFGDVFTFWHGYDANNTSELQLKYAKFNGSSWSAWGNLDTGSNPSVKWSQFNNPDTIELVYTNHDGHVTYKDITIPPSSPSNLIGIPQSASKILWSWTDNSLNETGFKLLDENGAVLVTTDKNVNQWLETGLNSGQTVNRTLEAYSIHGGESASIQGTSTTRALPSFVQFDGLIQGINNIKWTIRK